ncbi:MAG: choloylglycine hydrolase family protein [Candidatus Omnitrophica bacterium]|nr:choloylglycine hydrolase family protein [Candidatus Omnitrophota bacterium]
MNGKKKAVILIATVFFFALAAPNLSFACTDFQIKAEDNTVVIGRSMEFPIDLHSNVVIVPRGEQFVSIDDKGVKGITWTNKYGFLGVDAYNLKNCYVEGFNEKGLAFDALMFTGAKYQPAEPGKFVTMSNLGSWIMGNFATADEVKEALPKINVTGINLKEAGGELYMHIAVHDANGKNLVVEFIDGEVKIYDNPLGVMTNRPEFPWQITNLRNYINLDARDRKDRMLNGLKLEPTGVGSGLLGLPGDWTPPSRFVRVAYSLDSALPAKDAVEAVNLAEHLLNIVDIPKGAIKENPTPLVHMEGYAQWVVIKDLTNLVLYYKTYENTAWKKVDLKKFSLAPGAPQKSIVIDDKQQQIIDVTGELK